MYYIILMPPQGVLPGDLSETQRQYLKINRQIPHGPADPTELLVRKYIIHLQDQLSL